MGAKHDATRARHQAQQYRQIAGLVAAQPEEVRARRTAAEETYTNVLSRLGAKGTYGDSAPSGEGAPGGEGGDSVFTKKDVGADLGRFYEKKRAGGGVDPVKQEASILDKDKYQKKLEGSTQFRLMSKLTAEAEQLVNREGPLYDELINNTQLPIVEGSAALARENAEAIRKSMQRGGAARRTAFDTIQKIRAQERINSAKVTALANTRLQIDQWSRENAKSVLEFGQSWASNLGGIRESYQNAMDKASELMATQALPIVAGIEGKAEQSEQRAMAIRAKMHADNRAKVGRWVSGIMSIGSLALGGIGALGGAGLLGGQLSTFGALGSAMEPYAKGLASTGIKLGGAALGRDES